MSRRHRALAAVVALVLPLAACGAEGSDGPELSGATAQLCRLADVTYASLEGPRGSLKTGADPVAVKAYGEAITDLTAAVAGPEEIEPAITQAVTEMVAQMSRSRTYLRDSIAGLSFGLKRAEERIAAEAEAHDALLEVCPGFSAS